MGGKPTISISNETTSGRLSSSRNQRGGNDAITLALSPGQLTAEHRSVGSARIQEDPGLTPAVVDNFPDLVPVLPPELEAIETYLAGALNELPCEEPVTHARH